MQTYDEPLDDVARYIANHPDLDVESHEGTYRQYLHQLGRFSSPIAPGSKILEVGVGNGWFPIMCRLRGIECEGLEISRELVDHAQKLGREAGVDPGIRLGNIEEPLGNSIYDGIVVSNVFEHVEDWRLGLRHVYRALKPGGSIYFESTNKFSIVSGEYDMLFYGWLPNALRFSLRKAVHGPDIMKLGIDFHQFRHGQLRREFKRIGFTRIYDRIELAEEESVSTGFRRTVVQFARAFPPAKFLALTFSDATRFVCVK